MKDYFQEGFLEGIEMKQAELSHHPFPKNPWEFTKLQRDWNDLVSKVVQAFKDQNEEPFDPSDLDPDGIK